MKDWKTTLAGLFSAAFIVVAPQVQARLTGDRYAPPVTLQNVGIAAGIAVLGKLAKDARSNGE